MKKFQLHITPAARQQFSNLAKEKSNNFRVGVKGSGCNGFSYSLDYADGESKENDIVLAFENFNIFIDEKSSNILNDCKIDYFKSLMEERFVFYNPLAASTCKCGNSFDI